MEKHGREPSMDMTTNPTKKVSQRLPSRAEVLLNTLRGFLGKNYYCWPSRATLAKELGIAPRTVSFWLRHLADAGLIEIEITGRTSKYWIPPRHATLADFGKPELPKSARVGLPKSARVGATTIYELDPLEEEVSSLCENPSEPREHPSVEKSLNMLHAFDALTEPQRTKIEATVRENTPLFADLDDGGFRMECAAYFDRQMAERPFLEFKKAFIRRAPGMPKDTDFVDDWEIDFDRMQATGEEMLAALDCWIDDPRRDHARWEGGFARGAKRHLVKAIKTARELAKKASQEARRRSEAVPVAKTVETAPAASWNDHLLKMRVITKEEYEQRERQI
jgi:hypothetical protein